MKSQIFATIGAVIVAIVLVTGLTSSVYGQTNMTGGNMSQTMPSATDTSGDGDGGDGDGNGHGGEDNEEQDGEYEGTN